MICGISLKQKFLLSISAATITAAIAATVTTDVTAIVATTVVATGIMTAVVMTFVAASPAEVTETSLALISLITGIITRDSVRIIVRAANLGNLLRWCCGFVVLWPVAADGAPVTLFLLVGHLAGLRSTAFFEASLSSFLFTCVTAHFVF